MLTDEQVQQLVFNYNELMRFYLESEKNLQIYRTVALAYAIKFGNEFELLPELLNVDKMEMSADLYITENNMQGVRINTRVVDEV